MSKRKQQRNDFNPAWSIRLQRAESGGWMVMSADDAGQAGWEPFPFPPMTLSNLTWLTSLGKAMWDRHKRCLATWLILDCRQRFWVPPMIPHQRCGSDGAAWRADRRDLADLPAGYRVGGSFQTRLAAGLDEAASSVPSVNGFHLVQDMHPPQPMLYLFLHADGLTQCLEPSGGAVVDDWRQAIDFNSNRLEII